MTPLAIILIVNVGLISATIVRVLVRVRVLGPFSPSGAGYDYDMAEISSNVKEHIAVVIALVIYYLTGYFTLVFSADYITQPVFALSCSLLAFILLYLYILRKGEARRFWLSCFFLYPAHQFSNGSSDASFLNRSYHSSRDEKRNKHGGLHNPGGPDSFGWNRSSHFHPDSVPMSQVERNRMEAW